jgi:hypothetical protein
VATPLPEEIVQAESRFLNTVKDIEQCLKTVRDECTPLTLTIDGSATRITATVLDVIKRGILVEDIRPGSLHIWGRRRPRITLLPHPISQGNGIPTTAWCRSTQTSRAGVVGRCAHYIVWRRRLCRPDHRYFGG